MTGTGSPLVFGVTDLVTAIDLQLTLCRAEIHAWADIGQQGWPATVWIDPASLRGPVSRDLVHDIVWTAAPRTRRLRVLDIRQESVRLAGARLAVGAANARGRDRGRARTGNYDVG